VEKAFEEFYTDGEAVDWTGFCQLGVIKKNNTNATADWMVI